MARVPIAAGPGVTDRLVPDDPQVRALVDRVAPGSAVRELGGTMSLNLLLIDADLVLRVHPLHVSAARVRAERALKRLRIEPRVVTAEPVPIGGVDLVRCRGRVAELERYEPHTKPPPTWPSYTWLYDTLGRVHRTWRSAPVVLPRPRESTYGPPGSLFRYLLYGRARVRDDPAAAAALERVNRLSRSLAQVWTPARSLPCQLVHGDARLGNVAVRPDGAALVLDLGFAAFRPRVHDLAYTMAWIVLRPDDRGLAEPFDVEAARTAVDAYEPAAGVPLSEVERLAFGPYLASVALYLSAIAGFTADPVAHVFNAGQLSLVDIAEHVLARPGWPWD